jgi:hypothetical protein
VDGNYAAIASGGGNAIHFYGFNSAFVVPTAAENRPVNVAVPVILYLGRAA